MTTHVDQPWSFLLGGPRTSNPLPSGPGQRTLTDRALDFLDMIPPWAQSDPNIQAAIQVMSNECDRIDAALEDAVAMFFPQLADRYLYLWEASLGLSQYPEGLSLIQRQQRVLAFLFRRLNSVPGSAWVQNVTLLIGPTWTWTRHTPGSGTGPPADTIQINLPYASSSPQATDLAALLETITPANIEITINFGDGFVVQQSQIQSQII